MINSREKLNKYREILKDRYEVLLKELIGREADYEKLADRSHEARGRQYLKGFVDSANISDSLKVRMAVDDFMTILKEIKKLASK